MKTRQIEITTLPETALTTAHFHQTETESTQPAKGEVLLRTLLMSIDATDRAWMQGPTYRVALRSGDAMPTHAICEVVDSAVPSLIEDDIVMAETCWADYSTLPARKVMKLSSDETLAGPLLHFRKNRLPRVDRS